MMISLKLSGIRINPGPTPAQTLDGRFQSSMKISRHSIAMVAVLGIAGSATTPLWAFATPVSEVQVQVQPMQNSYRRMSRCEAN
jgi:hypothetical protein